MELLCNFCMNKLSSTDQPCPFCGRKASVETPPHRLLPGTILNKKFYVGEAIGEGGFGITYIGMDLNLDLKVAIKEYYPVTLVNRNNTVAANVNETVTDNKREFFLKGRERFMQEAKILARFSHENGIVEVRDFFEENNTAYIVMEYLDGVSLESYLEQNGNLTAEETIELLSPIMESLKLIHSEHLVHRDISPSNIMITERGIKLIDFGAARDVSSETQKNTVILKTGYAPEEQYRTKGEQGPWTDVYALSATMYKCITGVTPDDATQRLYDDELKKPSELGINIESNIEDAIMKGLSVRRKDRYQNIDELLKDLSNKPTQKEIPTQATTNSSGNDKPEKLPDKKDNNSSNMQEQKRFPVKIVAISSVVVVLIVVGIIVMLNLGNNTKDLVITTESSISNQNSSKPSADETEKSTEESKDQSDSVTSSILEAKQGNIGGIAWEFNNGVLTLSGDGEITEETLYQISESVPYVEGVSEESADEIQYEYEDSDGNHYIADEIFYEYEDSYVTHYYMDPVKSIIIKDGITKIGDQPFSSTFHYFTSITIPESVVSIGNACFYGCKKLENIILPSKIIEIPDWCFSECEQLTKITFSGAVNKIGHGAFCKCSSLTDIVIPESVTSIGDEAFEECTALTKIVIPDSVKGLGGRAFSGCTSLKNITLSNSIKVIPGNQFSDCSSLVEISIPEGVTDINYQAFYGCKSLNMVYIPKSVKSIGGEAFIGCTNLKTITIPNSEASIEDGAFNSSTQVIIGE